VVSRYVKRNRLDTTTSAGISARAHAERYLS
jgi:hypothetical protein